MKRGARFGARGAVFAAVILAVLFAGVLLGPLLGDTLEHYRRLSESVDEKSEASVRDARDALGHYMLSRALDRGEMKIRSGSTHIEPRLLMLPCPDNVQGDRNLDGTQDPTCGARNNSRPLRSGSRFGRLPWNFTAIAQSGNADEYDIADGLARDFKDGAGNRLWYSLSRNFAPIRTNPHLLNFHTISTITTDWLSVVNETGGTVASQVAAVVLSPGRPDWEQDRLHESLVSGPGLTLTASDVSADKYFEEVTVTLLNGTTITVTNFRNKRKFIGTADPIKDQTNDRLAYLTLGEMTSPDLPFLRQYKAQVGIRREQNNPRPGSPLASIAAAISAHAASVTIYPVPAALGVPENVETRRRHCAEWATVPTVTALVPESTTLIALETTTVTLSLSTSATATILSTVLVSDYTLWTETRISANLISPPSTSTAKIVLNDIAPTISSVAATIEENTTVILKGGSSVSIFPATLLAIILPDDNIQVSLRQTVILSDDTLLAPTGTLFATATIVVPAHATLTALETITAFAGPGPAGPTILAADSPLKSSSSVVVELLGTVVMSVTLKHEATITLTGGSTITGPVSLFAITTGLSIQTTGPTATVLLPHPTRLVPSGPLLGWLPLSLTVNSLRPAPPPQCFNFGSEAIIRRDSHRWFMEDQPMHYAVAGECHYGGDGNCGGGGGLTLAIGASVRFALPSTYTVTSTVDYAITLLGVSLTSAVSVFISGGTVDAISILGALGPTNTITLLRQWVPADEGYNARGFLRNETTLTTGMTLQFPAGTPFISRTDARVDNIRALLMFSPAPMRSADCTLDMSSSAKITLRVPSTTMTVIDQRRQHDPDDNLTKPCRWLDLDENADEDNLFRIPSPRRSRLLPDFNDYFILFGGNVSIVPPTP